MAAKARKLIGRDVLLVVDVQLGFRAATSELAARIDRAIERHRKAGWWVLELLMNEHEGSRLTVEPDLAVWKSDVCGAEVVCAALAGAGIRPRRVRICGVELVRCVARTADQLSTEFKQFGFTGVKLEVDVGLCGDAEWTIVNEAKP